MKFGVVGAGQMGIGIAQAALQAGYNVILTDTSEDALLRASDSIRKGLLRFERKGMIGTGESDAMLSRLASLRELDELSPCEIVVEAAPEDSEVKQQIFRDLDSIASEESVLATNTSSISITKLGSQTRRPEAVCGMHFMNPVPMMSLVEIVPGLKTSKETRNRVEAVAKQMGKVPIYSKDYPGFLVNRILLPMINEAVWAVYEGIGSVEDIDQAAQLGLNHPMGPLALADLIGLDTCLSILKVLHSEFGNPKYHPCPLLVKHVEAGYLGTKAGQGFYEYSQADP